MFLFLSTLIVQRDQVVGKTTVIHFLLWIQNQEDQIKPAERSYTAIKKQKCGDLLDLFFEKTGTTLMPKSPVENQLENYLGEPRLERHMNPLTYWQANQNVFPIWLNWQKKSKDQDHLNAITSECKYFIVCHFKLILSLFLCTF